MSASSALPTPSSKVGQLNKSVSKCPVWNDQFGNPFDCNQSSRGHFASEPTGGISSAEGMAPLGRH